LQLQVKKEETKEENKVDSPPGDASSWPWSYLSAAWLQNVTKPTGDDNKEVDGQKKYARQHARHKSSATNTKRVKA
jgi:hypothetical protein